MEMEAGDGDSLLYQILAPEPLLESLLLRLQKAGVGAVAGTGLTVIQSQLSYCGERADTVDGDTSHPSTQNTVSSNKVSSYKMLTEQDQHFRRHGTSLSFTAASSRGWWWPR